MKLQKLFVILLALLVVFSFAACDGSSSGNDDNGSTNGGNGSTDNGGGSGDGDEPSAVTWPVTYKGTELSEGGNPYMYIFYENSEYEYFYGEYNDDFPDEVFESGTYNGDPHDDGYLSLTGMNVVDDESQTYEIEIVDGSFTIYSETYVRQ